MPSHLEAIRSSREKKRDFYSISIEWMTLHASSKERRQQRSLLVEKIDNDFRKLLFTNIVAEKRIIKAHKSFLYHYLKLYDI